MAWRGGPATPMTGNSLLGGVPVLGLSVLLLAAAAGAAPDGEDQTGVAIGSGGDASHPTSYEAAGPGGGGADSLSASPMAVRGVSGTVRRVKDIALEREAKMVMEKMVMEGKQRHDEAPKRLKFVFNA